MCVNLWFFLSVCVIFGGAFAMYAMHLSHKKAMKQMELDAERLKSQGE